jgi:sulfur-oxidizing protein SoxB
LQRVPSTAFSSRRLLPTAFLAAALAAAVAAAARGDDRQVTFIHLNDLHANLVPHSDLVRTTTDNGQPTANVESRGGLARIATLVRRIREQAPGATVLMGIGDTYHGGVEALYTRGNAIVAPVDALGIDIGVPGNWDFAFGPVVTRLRYSTGSTWLAGLVNRVIFGEAVNRPGYPLLGGNVRKTLGVLLENEPLLPTTHSMDVGGVTVGFIGITSDIVPRMSPMLSLGFTFLQGQSAYVDLINTATRELRADGAELVVVMSELGLHRDYQLANHIDPGVNVFFSAHTHELTTEPLASASGALVVEAGNDGYLGKMTARIPDAQPPRFHWQILDVTDDVPEDPAMAALVDAARAPFLGDSVSIDYPMPNSDFPLDERIDVVIANSPTTLNRRGVLSNSFNEYLAEQIRDYYHTDVALTPGFRFDAVVLQGDPVTLENLYRYLPVPATLAGGNITGRNLKALFEKELSSVFSKDAFHHEGGWFLGISGLQLQVDLTRADGQRVISLRRAGDNSEILADDVLSVASCVRPFDESGVLCSGSGFTDVKPLFDPGGQEWTPLQFLRKRLEAGSPHNHAGHVSDVSHAPLWPTAEFIQPLQE